MEKLGKPSPLFGDVLIKNPLKGDMVASIEDEVKRLPEKEKQAFLEEKMKSMWGFVEILAVGPDCRALEVGDKVIASSQSVTGALPTPDGEYLLVSERSFRGRW